MGLRKDIWKPAIVAAPLATILQRGSVDGLPLTWLPPMRSFQFMADPFGYWRDNLLHVFVETYDYRVRIGRIEVLTYDANLKLLDHQPALSERWHLSYPFVFEAEGSLWMLPEASRSRSLSCTGPPGFRLDGSAPAPSHSTMFRSTRRRFFTRGAGGCSIRLLRVRSTGPRHCTWPGPSASPVPGTRCRRIPCGST